MNCPYCNHIETKVTDSRDTGNHTIRRRRECLQCNKRFTTYETVEMTSLYVIKRNGCREKFDRNKIKNGMIKALEKRPITQDKIEEMLDMIEDRIRQTASEEIQSLTIGEYVMESLKAVDQVAYIRFASVYRSFTDITSFEEMVKKLTIENTLGGEVQS